MKKLAILNILFIVLLSSQSFAQAPAAFSYQAVARNKSGEVLANQQIGLHITVYAPSDSAAQRYVETHMAKTNAYGLLDIEIGRGNNQQSRLDSLDWSQGSYFIKVAMDEKGGTDYHDMGMSELLSVPYALYAERTGTAPVADDSSTDELQVLSISNDTLYLSKGGSVELPKDMVQVNGNSLWNRNEKGIDFSEGKVGIGTTSPESQLHIVDEASKANGKPRQFITLKNLSNSSSSHTAITIQSGTDTNFNNGSFGVTPYSFNLFSGYGGYTYLLGSGNGLLLRARHANSHIRFIAGGDSDQYERLRISHDGLVGVGTTQPTSRLQINDGDIYIEDIDRGIIMKSPNGNCWRVTVGNSGEFVSTAIDCQ